MYSVHVAGPAVSDLEFTGGDLSLASLRGAITEYVRAYLARATLTGAKLARVNLQGVNLADADLSFADLTGATLLGANLGRAKLLMADLTGAQLFGADLGGAELVGARWPENAPVPEGWKLDTRLGRLKLPDANSGTAEEN
jgi:uncharacterized protein YjbI with pentapeptide repeats